MTPAAPVPHVTRGRPARSRLGRMVEGVVGAIILPLGLLGALSAAFAAMAASRLAAIGVRVQTGSLPGPSERVIVPGGTYFVVGQAERGSTTAPIEVRSLAEYGEKMGGRVTYGALYDDLQAFFAEGGARALVARVVGPAATKGALTLNATTGGAPTVVLTAKDPGAWSATLTVEVLAGILANTFTVVVRLNGAIVEQYLDQASPSAFVAAVNARSSFLTAVDSGNATAAPGNNPAVLAATALAAGTDDRASITSATYTAGLAIFGEELGTGAVAIPGQAASAVGAGLIAHARANNRLALLAPAAATSVSAAKTEANTLRATAGSEHAGMFYPWVKVPDGAGGTRTISPEGYVAALRSRAHRQAGPWRAPAGELGLARYVVGVERELTSAEVDELSGNRVNGIRTIAGAARLYGWRSLSTDQVNFVLLTGRDVLNTIAELAEAALERYVFEPVDARGHLFSAIEGELVGILEPMRQAGGLYERIVDGTEVDAGYVVDTGPGVNTPAVLANNEVRVDVAVRVSPVGELITLTVTKVALDVRL